MSWSHEVVFFFMFRLLGKIQSIIITTVKTGNIYSVVCASCHNSQDKLLGSLALEAVVKPVLFWVLSIKNKKIKNKNHCIESRILGNASSVFHVSHNNHIWISNIVTMTGMLPFFSSIEQNA